MRLAELIGRRLHTTALRADTANIDGWWDSIAPRVQKEIVTGHTALARLARDYLRLHAAAEGVLLEPVLVQPNLQQIAEALRVTGPVAFKTHVTISGDEAASTRVMATRLQGSGVRLAMAGPRQTTMQTFRQRRVVEAWRRVGQGATCSFCLMLVGRGAVYRRAETARFRTHDHCHCIPVLAYRREVEPPHVLRLQAQWREATAGTSGSEAITAWRRYVEGQK
ncbi:VG15 protein [Streptomyces sp. NPDC004069]